MRNGRLYRRNGNRPPTLCIFDAKTREDILQQAHEGLGHRGEYAVMQTIKERFYWPHMRNDIQHHVRSCHQCQIRSVKKVEVPIMISAPSNIFLKIYLDVMFMPRGQGGFNYIVAARDDLSRAAEGRALRTISSKNIAQFIWEEIFCRYGAVGQITTDNGGEVTVKAQ